MKKIILVTDGFPLCQSSESAFIIPELRELVKTYDVSIIACCVEAGDIIQEFDKEFDSSVRVYHYSPPKGQYFFQLWRFIYAVFDPVFVREILKAFKSGGNVFTKSLWVFLNYYWACDHFKWISRSDILKCNEEIIYYTFWNQYYLLSMAMHREHFRNMKIISRIHGYDLFEDRSPMKWQPFKNYMDEKTDRTIFISEQGKNYYEEHYQATDRSDKHLICRLGVSPRNVLIGQRVKDFLLVSCSGLVPEKRIELIIQALYLIRDKEIMWVHFGKGAEKERLEDLTEKLLRPLPNITVDFKGLFQNEDILLFYEKNNPSCFITTSLTEGSPVSMQEAIACGIPVIGTDVGGIYEMIDGNGYLLSAEPTAEEVAEAIQKVYDATDEEYMKMRQRSLEIWKTDFDRQKNNESFIRMLGEL